MVAGGSSLISFDVMFFSEKFTFILETIRIVSTFLGNSKQTTSKILGGGGGGLCMREQIWGCSIAKRKRKNLKDC